jgi:hypothetical protein
MEYHGIFEQKRRCWILPANGQGMTRKTRTSSAATRVDMLKVNTYNHHGYLYQT